MLPRINHIGIAVTNLTAAVSFYSQNFGFDISPPILTIEKASDTNNAIFQLNANVDTVKIAFLESANGIGIELFEFHWAIATENNDMRQSSHVGSNQILDHELNGVFHFAITMDHPEKVRDGIAGSGGRTPGVTVPLGKGHQATYNRDIMGNMVEVIDVTFEDMLNILFEDR